MDCTAFATYSRLANAARDPGASFLAHPTAFTCCIRRAMVETGRSEFSLFRLCSVSIVATKGHPQRLRLFTLRKCLGSGDPPGLQNRWPFLMDDGVFDSHALPPYVALRFPRFPQLRKGGRVSYRNPVFRELAYAGHAFHRLDYLKPVHNTKATKVWPAWD